MNMAAETLLPDHELWSDDDLIAAYQPGTNNVLAVCFLSYTRRTKLEDVRARRVRQSRIVGGGKNNVLYLTDLTWTCCARVDIREQVIGFVRQAAERCAAKKVVAYGYSGGATSALLLNADLRFDAVLAVSPQIDLREAHGAFDDQWRSWQGQFPADFKFPGMGASFSAGGNIAVLHGLRGTDAAQAALVPAGPNIHQYLFPDLSHSLGPRLRPGGLLVRIFKALAAGNIEKLDEAVLKAGGLRRGNLDYTASDYDWSLGSPTKERNDLQSQVAVDEETSVDGAIT